MPAERTNMSTQPQNLPIFAVICLSLLLVGTYVAKPALANQAESREWQLAGVRILVFSKTEGFRHWSIKAGKSLLANLADEHAFTAAFSEDSGDFTDESLGQFDAVLFLNTTGDVLNLDQQAAMERYIRGGGGYVGVHAATDTERDGSWPWYIALVGAAFDGHPILPSNVQEARLRVAQPATRSTGHFQQEFDFTDEWYDFSDLSNQIEPLLEIDRDSYWGSDHSGWGSIAWRQEYDGGRSFYTAMGHRKQTFTNQDFIAHLLGGIEYACARQGDASD